MTGPAPNTVYVKDIASTTDDKEIKDFFSFCGKIADLQVTSVSESKSAVVTFEQPTAAKTALLLNGTQLGPNQVSVSNGTENAFHDDMHFAPPPLKERDTDELTQEEKPRSRIFAEYLAHGYVVGDAALQRAIELDSKHGVTNRFMTTLQSLDKKYHATQKAKTADQSYQISSKAGFFWTGLGSYFEKASNTPTGKRLVKFYSEGSRQVQDIHAEARRLAEIKKDAHGGSAYKASGLERVFGKGKPAEAAAAPATAAPGTAAPVAATPGAAAPGIAAPAAPVAPAAAPENPTSDSPKA